MNGSIPKLKIHLITFLSLTFGSSFLAFGLYNIYELNHLVDGGVLGFALVLKHLFHISPAFSGFCLDALTYWMGLKLLGKLFIGKSLYCTLCFSAFYCLLEQSEPILAPLQNPYLAALYGGIWVGVACGLIIRVGGSSGGDEVLAVILAKYTRKDIGIIFFSLDGIVLILASCCLTTDQLVASFISIVVNSVIISLIVCIPLSHQRVKPILPTISFITIIRHKKRRYR